MSFKKIGDTSFKNMVNIPGNKVKVAQTIVGKKFLAKGFFVIADVYFQNMAIRNCDYPAVIV